MAKKKEETPEEKRRMLDFAHTCAQIASAETIADMNTTPILWEEEAKQAESETRKG